MAATKDATLSKKAKRAEAEKRANLIALCETLEDSPHIQTVYFDEAGNHFFIAREHDGKKYSRLGIKNTGKEVRDNHGNMVIKAETEILPKTLLVRSETREQILSRKPEPDEDDE